MSHWYRNDGSTAHFEGKAGKPTSLWDARRLLKAGDPIHPSVTKILKITDKPALTKWIAEEAAMAAGKVAISTPPTKRWEIGDRTWARHILAERRKVVASKASIGSGIHDALERYMCSQTVNKHHILMCIAVVNCIVEHCGEQEWTTEQSFSNTKLGYGGKCDLHSDEWIIDYKTKDTVDETTKGYKDQAEQLAAYAHGLGKPDARIANIFISRSPPAEGASWAVTWYEHTDIWAFDRFKSALRLWSITNKYGYYFDKLNMK